MVSMQSLDMTLLFKRFASTTRNVCVLNEATWPSDLLLRAKESCSVWRDFISEDEERSLMTEIEPHMKRLKAELDCSWTVIKSIVLVRKRPLGWRYLFVSWAWTTKLVSTEYGSDPKGDGKIHPGWGWTAIFLYTHTWSARRWSHQTPHWCNQGSLLP